MEIEKKTEVPGIKNEQLIMLVEILGYFDRIQYAVIYGSRVTGKHKPDSDLDVALSVLHPKSFCLSDIQDSLCSLVLERIGLEPHLKVIEEIKNPDLLHNIEHEGRLIYRKR